MFTSNTLASWSDCTWRLQATVPQRKFTRLHGIGVGTKSDQDPVLFSTSSTSCVGFMKRQAHVPLTFHSDTCGGPSGPYTKKVSRRHLFQCYRQSLACRNFGNVYGAFWYFRDFFKVTSTSCLFTTCINEALVWGATINECNDAFLMEDNEMMISGRRPWWIKPPH